MACCRSTLCQVEGSFLASMFSGRRENQQKKDKDGNVFLNFNPVYFKTILNFLRFKELSVPEYPPPAPVPAKDDFAHFYSLVNYLGLRAEFKPTVDEDDEFCRHDEFCNYASNISVCDNYRVVKFGYHNGEQSLPNQTETQFNKFYVHGQNCYENGRAQWKLEVMCWNVPDCVFIGVLEEDSNGYDDKKHIWYDKGANGWVGKQIVQNGNSKPNESVICVGALHILTLDLDAMTLSLANGRDTVDMKLQRAKDPENECYWWSLCVGFQQGTKSEVRLVD